MNKDYTTIPSYINSKPRSVYELYFNSVLKRRWVNSSRNDEDMVSEILRYENIPHYIIEARIVKKTGGLISIVWSYEKQSRKIYDMLTGEIYNGALKAQHDTGFLKETIINQCKNHLNRKRRFRYAKDDD